MIFNKIFTPTSEGTPQGGIISPTLANATLDGMEKSVKEKYRNRQLWNGKVYCPKVYCPKVNKYFKTVDKRNRVFSGTQSVKDTKQVFTLKKPADIPIVRHVKVKKDANTFDPQWFDYFAERSRKASKVLYAKA